MKTSRSPVGNAFLDSLKDAEFAILAPHLVEKYLPRDMVLHDPGAPVDDVYFPTSSILSVITLMEDGRSVESCTIGRESAHGRLFTRSAP